MEKAASGGVWWY